MYDRPPLVFQIPGNEELFPGMPAPSKRAKYRAGGTPAPQGSGPEGETCATCRELFCWRPRASRRYYKCKIIQDRWTNSYGTDIRLKFRACRYWKPQEEKCEKD